jgi:hypothetical protein
VKLDAALQGCEFSIGRCHSGGTNGGNSYGRASTTISRSFDRTSRLDSSGNIQHKGGSLDANWTVTGAVNPLNPPNAYVVAPGDADWGSSWIHNGAYSSWIAANPFDAHGNGLMTFTDTFNVATPSTAVIIGGAWVIDDSGTLSLNGHPLSTLTVSGREVGHLHAFSTTASDFVAGLNTLTMQITSTDTLDEAARLRGWLVGAGSAVSDPTSFLLMHGPNGFYSGQSYNDGNGFQSHNWNDNSGFHSGSPYDHGNGFHSHNGY